MDMEQWWNGNQKGEKPKKNSMSVGDSYGAGG